MSDNPHPLPEREGEPIFAEPWQAQAFAIAMTLVAEGRIAAELWSETLGAEIRQTNASGEPDTAASYHACVLRALERLVAAEGLAAGLELSERKADWVRAYENTPHGQPVNLDQR